MKKYSLSSALLPSTAMVFTCAAIHTAQAADDLWNVTGPASWTVGTNWSLGTPPATADRALIANGGSATLASGDAVTIDRFRLVNGSLAMTGGSLATTTTVDGDSLKIGDYAYNLAGGTVALTMSGAAAITAADRIYVADGEGTGVTTVVTNVTATLSDTASLTATNDYVILGRQNGTANVTLNNSAVIEKKGATNTFIIGDGVRGTGNVTLNDSSSLKSANQFVIGNAGTGNVTLKSTSSVLASSGTVTIGNGANSIGTVTLEEASTFTLSTGTCVLGNANTAQGTVTLKGTSAFNVLANEMYVGNASGGTGTLTISDNATLTKGATGFAFTIGRANGTGTVTVQNSGKLISQNSLRMTEGTTANATLNVKDSGTVQVTGAMQIGYQGTALLDVTSNNATVTVGGELAVGISAGKGTLRMTGGILNATTPNTYVVGGGNGAQATVTLSGTSALNGGNMKWKAGDYGGGTPTGSTNITLSDSAALTLRELTIGHIGGSTATANVTLLGSSTLTVNNFVTLGRDDAGTNGGMTASLNLNGGTLATKSVRSGGSASAGLNTINGNGGTIKALATEPDFFQPTSNNSTRPSVALGSSGLSFDTNSFTVGIKNALTGTGGLTKTGTGKLIFFSPQAFTGTTSVNQGTLELDTAGSLAGPLYAASGGTLSISGSFGLSATVPDLTLAGGSQLVLPAQSSAPVTASTVLATLGPVTVTVSGTLAVGDYPLIDHSAAGAIQGIGASAFQLAPLGRGVVASIVDEDGIVKLRVTAVNPLLWTGVNANSLWDIGTTSNWTLSGVSSTYQENDNVLFNDTATRTGVILNSTVNPSNVRFNNNTKDYTLSGTGAIAGATAGLTKDGDSKLTVTTANTYGGSTAVNGGILQFGDGTSNGSITGPLAVTGGSVVFNPAGSATYAGSLSGYGYDDIGISKTGSGTQIFTGLANTFDGPFAISGGTVKFGNGLINGELGTTTTYNLAGGTTLAIDFATAINFSASNNSPWSKVIGSGLVTLNSAQAINGSANWGQLSLTPDFTGSLSLLKGRVETPNPFSLGGTSALSLADGSQLLLLSSVDPYTTPLQIAGYGWGEGGYNYGALRVAANANATWGGNITLAANSGIFAQVNGQITVTGAISGAYALQLFAQAQAAEAFPATVTLAPTVQNTYASTVIDGNAGGMVKAGSQYAFSTGPLTANNATMWLNGYSFTFASLTGTSGKIGNYGTTPSVLTVGGDSTNTTYGGVILDGAAGTLALVKNGTGTLTLTGANTYTGTTTVHAGVLSVSTAFLGDVSAVSIDSGAVLDLNTTGAEDTVGTLFLGGVQVPAGIYGASTPGYGSYFTGTGTLVVTNGPETGGFSTWAASMGLDGTPGKENGTGDDPDKDGMDNLTEFYLDGNPLVSDLSILPVASLSQDYITLTFHRRDDAEASVTTQVAQYGQSLAGWAEATITAATSTDPNGVIVTVTENDAAADLVTVQIPRTFATGGKLFGRIKVEAP